MMEMSAGQTLETTSVGNEGIIGLSALAGTGLAFSRGVVRAGGTASRISVRLMAEAMSDLPGLQQRIYQYFTAFIGQLMRTATCNTLHSVEERLCRWLLIAHDRTQRDTFELTQEFLAEMLAVRRASVNQVGRKLQSAGLISYRRGRLTIIDRAGLEEFSCECYRAIRDTTETLYQQ